MDSKSHTKSRALRVVGSFKTVVAALCILMFLHLTGLISAASSATQWALLQSGMLDADAEADPDELRPEFDFNFTIKDLEGNRIPVESFKGKVIFLNMWATWCGPCRAEMPGIQALYSKVNSDNIVFIMLSIDPDEDLNRVKRYVTDKSFTFKAYLPAGYLTEQLHVPNIPTTFVISREGKIMKKEVGVRQYDTPEFQRFLENLAE